MSRGSFPLNKAGPSSPLPLVQSVQQRENVFRWIAAINARGEILDDENKVIGKTTRKDDFFLRNNILTARGEFLDGNFGKCIGYADYVWGLEPDHGLERVFDRTVGTEPKAQSKREQLLEGFAYAVYVYSAATPTTPTTSTARRIQFQRLNTTLACLTQCEILIVDEHNDINSLTTQFYLEFLRTLIANNGGPWLFHRVDSAGLNIRTPWRSSSMGRLDRDDAIIFKSPDENDIESDLKQKTVMDSFLMANDRPYETDMMIDRLRRYRTQGLDESAFSRYDHLVACTAQTFQALNILLDRAYDWDMTALRLKTNKKAPPRIHLLEVSAGSAPKFFTVRNFARKELEWQEPQRGIMEGGLRTSFVQLQLQVQMERVVGHEGENLRKIEERTKCKLYVAKQSQTYGWVVAIVGPWGQLWEPEHLVRELRGGREIPW